MSLPPKPGGESSHRRSGSNINPVDQFNSARTSTLLSRSRGDSMLSGNTQAPAPAPDTKSTVQAKLKDISGSVYGKALEVVLQGWNPLDFLDAQCLSRDERGLGTILVYCGSEERAYVSTMWTYVAKQWPTNGQRVLEAFQRLCDTKRTVTGNVSKCAVELRLGEDTKVQITGDRTTALEIVEVCVFLSMACQQPLEDNKPSYCTPLVRGPGSGWGHFRVSATHNSLKASASNGLCWLAMVNNPVMTYGYPIPPRPSSALLGLEVEFSLLVRLSSVEYANSIGGRCVLKSHFSALVSVAAMERCVVWHLCYQLPYVSFEDVLAVDSQPNLLPGYTVDTLSRNHRHIVGWTPSAVVVAGAGRPEMYHITYSGSSSGEQNELRLDDALVGTAWKINDLLTVSVSALVNIIKRDLSAKLDSVSIFDDIQIRAVDKTVCFYSKVDARAWLLDGRSALLHLTKAYLQDEDTLEVIANFDPTLPPLVKGLQLVGGSSGASTMSNKETMNRHVLAHLTISDIVVGFWLKLEAMAAAIHSAEYGPQLAKSGDNPVAPHLIGWEYYNLMNKATRPLHPGKLTLKAGASAWRNLIYDRHRSSPVIFGYSFGDMISNQFKPNELNAELELTKVGEDLYTSTIYTDQLQTHCPRVHQMPKGHDWLAIPHMVLRRWAHGFNQTGRNTLQVMETRHLKVPTTALTQCMCKNAQSHCNFITTLHGSADDDKSDGRAVREMLDQFPEGAIIVGESKLVKGSGSK